MLDWRGFYFRGRWQAIIKGKTGGKCCADGFKVEALIGVDERGQMVLPKEVREKAGIRAGDKLAVVSMERNGAVCCIALIKVEDLTEMVRERLGPVMKEILAK